MAISSEVVSGEPAAASDVNDIRTDALNIHASVGSEQTISSQQVIISVDDNTFYRIDTFGDAAESDLNSLLAGVNGRVLIIAPAVDKRHIIVSPTGGSITPASGYKSTLHDMHDNLILVKNPGTGFWTEPIHTPAKTGWVRASWAANDAWDYVSATTLSIPDVDYTSILYKGMKLRLLQDSTIKYFYIIDVTYSDPDTIVTVTGGDDYSLANESISYASYSMADNPQGFPSYFEYTPAASADGSMTWTTIAARYGFFRIVGGYVHFTAEINATTGGTASNALGIGLPVTADVSAIGSQGINISTYVANGSDSVSGVGFIASTTPTVVRCRQYNATNYGLGSGRLANANGMYPI